MPGNTLRKLIGRSQDETFLPCADLERPGIKTPDFSTCSNHNSSKSTNFSASRLSCFAARGDLAVGALLKKTFVFPRKI